MNKISTVQRRWLVAGAGVATLVFIFGLLGARASSVQTARVQRRELVQTVVASGRVLAPAKIQLGTVTLGVVAQVGADEGQHVSKGQLLLRLDDQEAHAAVEQAKANVAQARIRFDQLQKLRAPVAAQELRQAELSLAQAQTEFERQHDLLQRGAVAQADYDKSQNALEVARSRYQGAALQADNTAAAGSDFRLAATAVAQAQAALDQANARLMQEMIVAPADGVIIGRSVEAGDVVQPGKVLLTLAQAGDVRLLVPFDEKNLAYLQVGQAAQASAEAFATLVFAAQVETIAPAVDARRGTVDVKLKVPAPPAYLRPDMTVSVEVEIGRRADALVVPSAAVRDAASREPWVYVIRDGKTERQTVVLGLRGDALIEIAQGVSEGDSVVIEGQAGLKPGARVRAKNAGA